MGKQVILCCQEKHRREVLAARTPNRHRWSGREYSGDRENHGEGTRQNAPVTSGEGGPSTYYDLLRKGVVAAETSGKRLFTKNTGPCEHANGCIRTDACPVLEG